MKKNKPLITLRIIDKNGIKVKTMATRKTKRVYSFIKGEKLKDCTYKLAVRYEKGSENEGEYKNKKDLRFALRAFTETW